MRHANNTKTVKVLNYSRTMRFLTNLRQMSVRTCSKYRGESTSLLLTITPSILKIRKVLNNISPIVIKKMKAMFSKHGIPKLDFSDNGPEFTLLEFWKFSANWDFEHNTGSPSVIFVCKFDCGFNIILLMIFDGFVLWPGFYYIYSYYAPH